MHLWAQKNPKTKLIVTLPTRHGKKQTVPNVSLLWIPNVSTADRHSVSVIRTSVLITQQRSSPREESALGWAKMLTQPRRLMNRCGLTHPTPQNEQLTTDLNG